ncbi:MAG: GDSL-type esterase/lipase family protein [Phycisphaeraceae bacterium]
MKEQLTRRAMLTGTAATTAAIAAATVPGQAHAHPHVMAAIKPAIELKKGATILLQGDSITDAGRKRDNLDANNMDALGKGYASLIAYHLLTANKDKKLKLYNRGISGHKVPDLDGRWERDCIELKPDVLSIMIGVNDYWHTVAFGSKYKGTVDDYKTGFNALLKRTKDALPDVQEEHSM